MVRGFASLLAARCASSRRSKELSVICPLDRLVRVREESVKARKSEIYRYAEIGDINVTTGGISFSWNKGPRVAGGAAGPSCAGGCTYINRSHLPEGHRPHYRLRRKLVTTNALLNFCGSTCDARRHAALHIRLLLFRLLYRAGLVAAPSRRLPTHGHGCARENSSPRRCR